MKKDILNYIDWNNICRDYDLESGDLSLDHTLKLEYILEYFIETNK